MPRASPGRSARSRPAPSSASAARTRRTTSTGCPRRTWPGSRPGRPPTPAFLNAKGHLLGEAHVLAREGDLLVELDPAAVAETRALLEKLVIMDEVEIEDVSAELRVLPVIGPDGPARLAGRAPGAPRIREQPPRRAVPRPLAARGGGGRAEGRAGPGRCRAARRSGAGRAAHPGRRAALRRRHGRLAPAHGGGAHAVRHLLLQGLLHRPGGGAPRHRPRPPAARAGAARAARRRRAGDAARGRRSRGRGGDQRRGDARGAHRPRLPAARALAAGRPASRPGAARRWCGG